jgi:hypothetical protein
MLAELSQCTNNALQLRMATSATAFAEELAAAVRTIVGQSDAELLPLRFAFYTNMDRGADQECLTARTGPFYVRGGGSPLCHFVEAGASVGSKRLGEYLATLLNMTDPASWDGGNTSASSSAAKQMVLDFGFSQWDAFAGATPAGGVYSPRGGAEQFTLPELKRRQVDDGLPFHGMSGGGGAGAGFEILCIDDRTGAARTLVSGGGGGGGGMSSPEHATALRSGGGGGGGAQVAGSRLGAGAGSVPRGVVDVGADVDARRWVEDMAAARGEMRACATEVATHIALRGGGGGGGGVEAYKPWNVSDPGASPEE